MHTSQLGHNIIAHHDGGYEGGPVILVIPAEQADLTLDDRTNTVSVTVPFEALKDLVANYLRGEAIDFYEQASADQVLRAALNRGTADGE